MQHEKRKNAELFGSALFIYGDLRYKNANIFL